MVLQAELYPNGGYQQQGYWPMEDYYSKCGYEDKEDYYSENGYYNSGSSMQMMRPNITPPQPPKHYLVSHESYANEESGYGKPQSYGDHDSHGRLQYPNGMHHSDGYGRTGHSFNGHESHGYPNYPNGMHHSASDVGYESHHGSYMPMSPIGYESMSYDFYGEGRNRCPPYPEQQHKANKYRAAKGAEWVSKGV